MFATQIQEYGKKMIHQDQVGFIPEIREWFNIYKSIDGVNHIHGLSDKNCMTNLTDTEKSFSKIQNAFMTKVLGRTRLEGTLYNITKATQDITTANFILSQWLPT